MQPASCKAKGRRLQNWVAEQIRGEFDLNEDDVRATGMGANGEDIKFSTAARQTLGNISIECKCQERLNLFEAWQQAKTNAKQHHPLLVLKKNHSEVLCVLQWTHLMELLKNPLDSSCDGSGATSISLPAPTGSPQQIAHWLRALADELEKTA